MVDLGSMLTRFKRIGQSARQPQHIRDPLIELSKEGVLTATIGSLFGWENPKRTGCESPGRIVAAGCDPPDDLMRLGRAQQIAYEFLIVRGRKRLAPKFLAPQLFAQIGSPASTNNEGVLGRL